MTEGEVTSVVIPEGVTHIGISAFEGRENLSSIVLPESVTRIGRDAFSGCSGLVSIVLPEALTYIDDGAFFGCSGLVAIVLPGVTHIGMHVFNKCRSLNSIVLPEGVTHIGISAFTECSGLVSIVIHEGVTHLLRGTFNGCSGLTSITLPEGLTHIEIGAFKGCSGLVSILLPEGVTQIGHAAFSGCSGLVSIVLPDSVTIIEPQAFCGCTWLVVIRLLSRDPILFSTDAFTDRSLSRLHRRWGLDPHDQADDNCNHLSLVVAPRASGLVGTTFAAGCPLLEGTGIVEDTTANQRRALDLRYWRVHTHLLCSAPHRRWVQTVLLVANRLRGGALELPNEMWHSILGSIRRWELGRVKSPVLQTMTADGINTNTIPHRRKAKKWEAAWDAWAEAEAGHRP
jgi:hypothetical protein